MTIRAGGTSLAVLLILLTGCHSAPPTAQERAEQKTLAACRERADQVYAEQNRGAVYTQDNSLSPFSSSYVSGITSRGLGERYGRDVMISDCVRNAGAAPAGGSAAVDRSAGPTMQPIKH